MNNNNTICAISTASGIGAIAVIRISGKEAFNICDKIFQGKRKLSEVPANTVIFGQIVNRQSSIVNLIDEVLVSVFRAPHSFTGEDSIEISCHASPYIQQKILQLLVDNGCTLAKPGEFTQRAFLNGKMDLSQAEAIADVIASTSEAALRMAMNQMRGGFSHELLNLRSQLLDFVSLIELELDFSEEDVEFANRKQLHKLVEEIQQKIARLVNSFRVGNAIKQGIPVAIAGKTNVGKSTLLNALLNEERAIVSDIHGTTRDVIEDCITLGGVQFRFIDTAGIRKTADTVENLGIERTYQKIQQASILLLLIDATHEIAEIQPFIAEHQTHIAGKKTILVFNKSDSISAEKRTALHKISADNTEKIFISAKNKEGITELEKLLIQAAALPSIGENDVIVSNLRHYEALQNAQSSIERVIEGLKNNLSGDFLSQDIRECMHYLSEITGGGEITTDEVLGNIFSRFCIGK
ncbi:MAG: tRNA uridine-5-carboxymethylaminomethyl(34) synthesis GTPase MnmE [Prevotellaceae bacterium]|jgi:tRNA modification GTPase|nr:tRNA uridine-5-carboxymethylaminomethyl(34) synthesis GTPase MnmE [Prevotellaceae bacterium]